MHDHHGMGWSGSMGCHTYSFPATNAITYTPANLLSNIHLHCWKVLLQLLTHTLHDRMPHWWLHEGSATHLCTRVVATSLHVASEHCMRINTACGQSIIQSINQSLIWLCGQPYMLSQSEPLPGPGGPMSGSRSGRSGTPLPPPGRDR
jgi:hypothetical protein